MRTKNYLFLMVIGSVLGAVFLLAEDIRTWNMIGGGYFEAKLTGVGTTTVTLQNNEGRSIDMPLANLKLSDQDYVRKWQQAQSGSGALAAAVEQTDFAKRVYKSLVYSKGKRLAKFQPDPSDKPKYFAFYRSAHWCPPCRKFTPSLVEFYNKQKSKGAAFELIFVSSDREEDAMAEYMNEYKMPWPAFRFGENKDLVKSYGSGIPNLIVTDADGNKLLDSYNSAKEYTGPSQVMAELEKLLQQADASL